MYADVLVKKKKNGIIEPIKFEQTLTPDLMYDEILKELT